MNKLKVNYDVCVYVKGFYVIGSLSVLSPSPASSAPLNFAQLILGPLNITLSVFSNNKMCL